MLQRPRVLRVGHATSTWPVGPASGLPGHQPGDLHQENSDRPVAVHRRQRNRRLIPKTRAEARSMRSLAELGQLSLDLRDHGQEGHHDHWKSYRYHATGHGETDRRHHHHETLAASGRNGQRAVEAERGADVGIGVDVTVEHRRSDERDPPNRDHRLLGLRAVLPSQVPPSESRATHRRQSYEPGGGGGQALRCDPREPVAPFGPATRQLHHSLRHSADLRQGAGSRDGETVGNVASLDQYLAGNEKARFG